MDRSQFHTQFAMRRISRRRRWVIFIVLCWLMLGCRSAQSDAVPFTPSPMASTGAVAGATPLQATAAPTPMLDGNAITPSSQPTVISVPLTQRWRAYVNQRYRYSIRLPAEWPAGVELPDGSGLSVDLADVGVSMRIQAYPDPALEPTPIVDMPEFPEILHAKIQWITLTNGYSGRLNMRHADEMISYELIRYTQECNVHV